METVTVSQNFNDNVNNPNTELCFHCRTYKLKNNFTNPEGENVCNACYSDYEKLCKEKGIRFIEEAGREAKEMTGTLYYLTDVYAINGKKKHHLGGYDPKEGHYNFVNHRKAELFGRKVQYLNSNGGFMSFHCAADVKTPLEFIDWVKENNYNFGDGYDSSIKKYGGKWEFHGNLDKISCAFSFRIFSGKLANQIKEKLQDAYFKNITIE